MRRTKEAMELSKGVERRARALLNDAALNSAVCGNDDAFLRQLIELHPEAEHKIGVGIDHFEVKSNQFNGRTFWLIRVDGTKTDFSFLACVRGTQTTARARFQRACRDAVHAQILAFKNITFDSTGSAICPITGEVISRSSCHIDHASPWEFERSTTILPPRPSAESTGHTDAVPTSGGQAATLLCDDDARANTSPDTAGEG